MGTTSHTPPLEKPSEINFSQFVVKELEKDEELYSKVIQAFLKALNARFGLVSQLGVIDGTNELEFLRKIITNENSLTVNSILNYYLTKSIPEIKSLITTHDTRLKNANIPITHNPVGDIRRKNDMAIILFADQIVSDQMGNCIHYVKEYTDDLVIVSYITPNIIYNRDAGESEQKNTETTLNTYKEVWAQYGHISKLQYRNSDFPFGGLGLKFLKEYSSQIEFNLPYSGSAINFPSSYVLHIDTYRRVHLTDLAIKDFILKITNNLYERKLMNYGG